MPRRCILNGRRPHRRERLNVSQLPLPGGGGGRGSTSGTGWGRRKTHTRKALEGEGPAVCVCVGERVVARYGGERSVDGGVKSAWGDFWEARIVGKLSTAVGTRRPSSRAPTVARAPAAFPLSIACAPSGRPLRWSSLSRSSPYCDEFYYTPSNRDGPPTPADSDSDSDADSAHGRRTAMD